MSSLPERGIAFIKSASGYGVLFAPYAEVHAEPRGDSPVVDSRVDLIVHVSQPHEGLPADHYHPRTPYMAFFATICGLCDQLLPPEGLGYEFHHRWAQAHRRQIARVYLITGGDIDEVDALYARAMTMAREHALPAPIAGDVSTMLAGFETAWAAAIGLAPASTFELRRLYHDLLGEIDVLTSEDLAQKATRLADLLESSGQHPESAAVRSAAYDVRALRMELSGTSVYLAIFGRSPAVASTPRQRVGLPPLSVLVVDDHGVPHEVRAVVQDEGCTTQVEDNPDEAVRRISGDDEHHVLVCDAFLDHSGTSARALELLCLAKRQGMITVLWSIAAEGIDAPCADARVGGPDAKTPAGMRRVLERILQLLPEADACER